MRVHLLLILVVCCGCGTTEDSTSTEDSMTTEVPSSIEDFTSTEVPPSAAGKLTAKGHTTDGLDVVKASVESGNAVLIDVREQREWDAGHLKDASLIPMSVFKSGELTAEMKEHLPKDKE